MSARAGIVVTGTEVLSGRVQDRNGPWLADRLLELGVELAHITICGDRPEDIEAQLRFMADQGVDLILTSGGLGPTADDMTVEVVARFSGRELVLDEELEQRIYAILEPLMKRFRHWDPEAMRAANRKQALIPEGATVIDPVGTAPGVIVPGDPVVVVLPGPPRELQPMWRVAVESEPVQGAIAARTAYDQSTVRMFGLPESGLAETLREAEREVDGFEQLEITTCLRRGEIEMVTRYEPGAEAAYESLMKLVRERHTREIFSEDGSRIDDLVAELLAGRRLATAESCTAGLLAARLTDRPGSSAYVDGGVVAYANEAKTDLLGVDPALIEAHGAVSEEVAEAMAAGALERFGADTAISITGIAGPDGGSEEKPVGTVVWSVQRATATRSRAARSCPATAPTSASAPRPWRCTCSGALSRAWRTASSERPAGAHVRRARPPRGGAGGAGRLARRARRGAARPAARPSGGAARDARVPRLAGRGGRRGDRRGHLRRAAGGCRAAPRPGRGAGSAPARPASVRARPGGRGRPRGRVAGGRIGRARGRALVPAREAPVLAAHHAGARQAR